MKIKIIDYMGKEKIFNNVKNIYFTMRGYRIEFVDELGNVKDEWRECGKFSTNVQDSKEFDHVITEW